MLDALLRSLQKHGYKPLYHAVQSRMQDVVRSEMLRAQPPRLLIAQHNSVTRAQALGRSTVIADTVQDGYKQMTSFCRYVRNVKDCDAELEKCLLSAEARNQMTYRWAGREEEDEETYIDLPLSSGHPALSTTVLRHVFPDVTLDVKMWNVVGSSCEENANLRKVYKRYYRPLDKQVQMLRQRILYMTGYPSRSWPEDNLTLVDMLDAAERIERKKYDIRDYNESTKGVSRGHGELMQSEVRWHRFENGSFILGRPPKK